MIFYFLRWLRTFTTYSTRCIFLLSLHSLLTAFRLDLFAISTWMINIALGILVCYFWFLATIRFANNARKQLENASMWSCYHVNYHYKPPLLCTAF